MTVTQETTPRDAALEYAAAGLQVLPLHTATNGVCSCNDPECGSPGKHPLTRNGLTDATTDPAIIAEWWRRWPTANVGIRTGAVSGTVVLDVDDYRGGGGTLLKLAPTVPRTPEVLTGGGGRHFFFQHPGSDVGNARDVGNGLDIRGDGGYVVAPPSIHASGRPYKWSRPLDTALAPLPAWLTEPPNGAQPARLAAPLAPIIPAGGRNNALASLAGSMRRRGTSPDAILAALRVTNQESCQPPLPDRDIERIARSVGRYEPARPLQAVPDLDKDPGPEPQHEPETESAEPVRFGHTLTEFLALPIERPPPFLGEAGDIVIPAGGLLVLAGMPGAGKTTLVIDLAFHLASRTTWLGLDVPRPLNILLIENEGPEYLFQDKLERKAAAWQHELTGQIHIHTWKWADFSFLDTEAHKHAREYLDANNIDIVIGDPLDTLGTIGVGSPSDTREFPKLLVPLGLTKTRSFLFLHHFRKEVSASEINQVSGAWGGRLDSLLVLKETDSRDEIRLSFPKLRHGKEGRNPLILGKMRDVAGFEVLGEETHAPGDKVAAMLSKILAQLRRAGTPLNRSVLALRLQVEHNDGSFGRALGKGVNDGLIAKGQDGKKVLYTLTEQGHNESL